MIGSQLVMSFANFKRKIRFKGDDIFNGVLGGSIHNVLINHNRGNVLNEGTQNIARRIIVGHNPNAFISERKLK